MDLTTTYLGLDLRTPLVASASPLSQNVDGVRRLADSLPAFHHPVEENLLLVGQRLRMRQTQRVAMRPAVALLILDRLIRQRRSRLVRVPRRHRPA